MEAKDDNENMTCLEKLIQLNKTLEKLQTKTLNQNEYIEAFLSSNNNLETNDFGIYISINLFSLKKNGELEDDPFYESSIFESFLDVSNRNVKGYYLLEKEFPNQSFCATLIYLRQYDLTLEQILSIETIWYEVNISLQNTNDKRFQK